MRLRRDLRTAGGLLAAPLGIALLDTAGINVDAIGRCAPTQIDVTVFDAALDVEAVRFFGEIVREGSVADVHTCRIEDAAHPGRVIGFGTTSWAVMAPTPPGFVYVDPGPGVRRRAGPPAARRRVRRGASRRRGLRARRPVAASRRRLAPSGPDPGDARSRRPRRRTRRRRDRCDLRRAHGHDDRAARQDRTVRRDRAACCRRRARPSPVSRSCATTAKAGVSSRPASRCTGRA